MKKVYTALALMFILLTVVLLMWFCFSPGEAIGFCIIASGLIAVTFIYFIGREIGKKERGKK